MKPASPQCTTVSNQIRMLKYIVLELSKLYDEGDLGTVFLKVSFIFVENSAKGPPQLDDLGTGSSPAMRLQLFSLRRHMGTWVNMMVK